MKIGVDASTLKENRTGVANYIYHILIELVQITEWQFVLYSNQDISFPYFKNVEKKIHVPYRKGPAWVNTQLLIDLQREPVDLFWGGNGYLPVFLPQKTAAIVTIHDLVYKQAGHTMPWISRLSRKIFQPSSIRKADCIVAVSQATNDEIVLDCGIAANAVIHPQVSIDYKLSAKKEVQRVVDRYRLPNEYLLVLGTKEPRKNLVTLLEAYKSIIEAGADLPALAVAGGKGWLPGRLPELLEKGKEQGWLKELGYVEQADMAGLYAGAQAFVLPSVHEGFGMPVLEAQMCGTPILASNIPSLKEASDQLGCYFQPDFNGICEMLNLFARAELPLQCRLPMSVNNDPTAAAWEMKSIMETTFQDKKA